MLLDGVKLLEGSDFVNLTLPSGSSFPSSPDVGEVFFKTTDNKVYVYFNTAWNELASSAGTSGSIVVSSGASLPATNTSNEGDLFVLTTTNKLHGFIGGAWVQLSDNATTPTPNIYDVAVSVPGTITPESTLAFFIAPRAFLLPADLSESLAVVGTNNGDADFLVYRNSTLAVTISFTNGSTIGTLTPSFSETVYFNGNTNVPYEGVLFDSGDVFQVFAPATNVPESFAVTFKANIPL
jgi:hypothetical protein